MPPAGHSGRWDTPMGGSRDSSRANSPNSCLSGHSHHSASSEEPGGSAVQAQQQPAVGWGQAPVQMDADYQEPCFGRRPNPANRRGRGPSQGPRGPSSAFGRSPSHWQDRQGSSGGGRPQGQAQQAVHILQSLPPGQPLPKAALQQALLGFDSRAVALLLKDLNKSGLGHLAAQLFDWLRSLPCAHPLAALCDVYTWTAMVSLCMHQQDAARAQGLVGDMRARGVPPNVHTYTALMNVCIKCGRLEAALETYQRMRQEGCTPNVVTYNTLIDVHGKMGCWEQALQVVGTMKQEGVEPVLRTFNTLIIACNMCNQPREAMAVHRRMIEEGLEPNATSYNALISAYGKAVQLDNVMEVFREMVWRGCERSVITYSSLISACEKAGEWQLALDLFGEMHAEGVQPNTVTYNSLITACAQGGQWTCAAELLQHMQAQGCPPDVVTYTALISACGRAGEWQRALAAFGNMAHQGCRPDTIVYNAIIDTLWETGVFWAQHRGMAVFKEAVASGYLQPPASSKLHASLSLHAMTAGVAMLTLHSWLLRLQQAAQRGQGLPATLSIACERQPGSHQPGKSGRDQGNLAVKEALGAMLHAWGSPFSASLAGPVLLEAAGQDVAAWVCSADFQDHMAAMLPALGSVQPAGTAAVQAPAAKLSSEDEHREALEEQRCSTAYEAVQDFEQSHCLVVPSMGQPYLEVELLSSQGRAHLARTLLRWGKALGARPEVAHDSVLVMDRVMSTGIEILDNLLELLAASCLVVACQQGQGADAHQLQQSVERVTGLQAVALQQMEWNVRRALSGDTSAISTLRVLHLYLERLGSRHLPSAALQAAVAGRTCALVEQSLLDVALMNCRPSVVAAAVLYADRRRRGVIPFWPVMLAKLTGYADMGSPELSAAIKAALRLAGHPASPLQSPSAPQLQALDARSSSPVGGLITSQLSPGPLGPTTPLLAPPRPMQHAADLYTTPGLPHTGSSASLP